MIALMAAASLMLAGCATEQKEVPKGDSNVSETTPEPKGTEKPQTFGGWEVNDEVVTAVMTEEAQTAFDAAMEKLVGVGYTPAALLATQVVSGTNYLILCQGTTVTATPEAGWYIVKIYQNLQGEAEVSSIEKIDLNDVKTADAAQSDDLLGGWKIQPVSNAITLPQDVSQAFTQAADAYEAAVLNPLALMAKQVVNGTNYMIFCQGTDADGAETFYIVKMYVTLDGESEISEAEMIDITAYVK